MRRRRSNAPPDFPSNSSSASAAADLNDLSTATTTMTLPVSSSLRDRTAEFHAIIAAARPPSANKAPTTPSLPPTAPRSDFSRIAANVGKDIQQTSVKLAKLTKLAQRRSLFDDPTAEIQELTSVIKQDIAALNAKLSDLQRLRDAMRRSANKQAGDHSDNVVLSLKGQLGATAQGFQKVLKMRTDSLAAQHDRRAHFMGSNSSSAPIFEAPAGSVALDLGQGSVGANSAQHSLPSNGFAAQQQGALTMRRPGESTYQQARADAVRQVESTIVELGQIFNQLATMVTEQGELVERIDANVDETVTNMESGQNQLMIYYNSIAGNRALILKVFGVLLAFVVFWVLIH